MSNEVLLSSILVVLTWFGLGAMWLLLNRQQRRLEAIRDQVFESNNRCLESNRELLKALEPLRPAATPDWVSDGSTEAADIYLNWIKTYDFEGVGHFWGPNKKELN